MKKLLIIALILGLLFPKIVFSQNFDDYGSKPALGVDPAIIEEILNESTPSKRVINVFNLSNLALPIKVSKSSFTPQDKLNYPEDKLSIYDASSWIDIAREERDFILQPKSKKTITLNISQPTEASPGGHYATIYFEPLIPAELISQESVFVYARAAVLIFMQTRGDIVENLKINKISASPIHETGSFKIDTVFENIGNTHLLPAGKINIYDDLRNNLLTTIDLNPSLILPGTEKSVSVDVTPGIVVGKISAQLVLDYGASHHIVQSERIPIFVFPYKIVAIVGILLFILLFLRKRIIKSILVLFDINLVPASDKVKLNTNLGKK